MVYTIFYRRPAKAESDQDSVSSESKQKSINDTIASGCSCTKNGIPEALAFDKIIEGGTCPPCTTRDFMNYLKYVEYSAENLQFFLWFRSYQTRWAELSESEQALSPEWTRADADAAGQRKVNSHFKEIELPSTKSDPFGTPPKNPFDGPGPDQLGTSPSTVDKTWSDTSSTEETFTEKVEAFGTTDMRLVPFTTQPYRSEITRIITTYLTQGASRELNLSGRERQAVLRALQKTTHPSAFAAVVTSAEYSLRKQAHPNFIRWTICNGNRPRVIFARGLGIFAIAAGLIADLLLTLSDASRSYRIIPFIAWFVGIATLIAAYKGMCVVLHGLHHRHLRPWELFEEETERVSWDSLASTSSNSFEDEPWVPRYDKRNFIRKIFDREVWVQEPALRQIQDTIFLQALLGSFILSCIAVGIFCASTAGNFY